MLQNVPVWKMLQYLCRILRALGCTEAAGGLGLLRSFDPKFVADEIIYVQI